MYVLNVQGYQFLAVKFVTFPTKFVFFLSYFVIPSMWNTTFKLNWTFIEPNGLLSQSFITCNTMPTGSTITRDRVESLKIRDAKEGKGTILNQEWGLDQDTTGLMWARKMMVSTFCTIFTLPHLFSFLVFVPYLIGQLKLKLESSRRSVSLILSFCPSVGFFGVKR